MHLDTTFTGMGGRNAPSQQTNMFASKQQQPPIDKMPSLKKLADKLAAPKPPAHNPSPDFVPDDVSGMEVGMQIEHQKFGFGVIQTLEGGTQNKIASIDFGAAHGVKKIMLNFAKLRIVK